MHSRARVVQERTQEIQCGSSILLGASGPRGYVARRHKRGRGRNLKTTCHCSRTRVRCTIDAKIDNPDKVSLYSWCTLIPRDVLMVLVLAFTSLRSRRYVTGPIV